MTLVARNYPAKLLRVIDGDTFHMEIDLGFYCSTAQKIRLRGVDTPEVHGATKAAGLVAAARAGELLKGDVLIVTTKDDHSFERWVASVYLEDGSSLATRLLDEGLAVVMER